MHCWDNNITNLSDPTIPNELRRIWQFAHCNLTYSLSTLAYKRIPQKPRLKKHFKRVDPDLYAERCSVEAVYVLNQEDCGHGSNLESHIKRVCVCGSGCVHYTHTQKALCTHKLKSSKTTKPVKRGKQCTLNGAQCQRSVPSEHMSQGRNTIGNSESTDAKYTSEHECGALVCTV